MKNLLLSLETFETCNWDDTYALRHNETYQNIDNTCNDDTSFKIRHTNTIVGTIGNRQRKLVLIMNDYNWNSTHFTLGSKQS